MDASAQCRLSPKQHRREQAAGVVPYRARRGGGPM